MVDRPGVGGPDLPGDFGGDSGHHHRRPPEPEASDDGENLPPRLPLAEYDLREPPPQVTVMVDLGEAQVLEREEPELPQRLFEAQVPPLQRPQNAEYPLLLHDFLECADYSTPTSGALPTLP